VNVFPLGIPNQDHFSFVVNAPKYIAINQGDQLYLEFSEKPALDKEKFLFPWKRATCRDFERKTYLHAVVIS
jgi:hypothetical protein